MVFACVRGCFCLFFKIVLLCKMFLCGVFLCSFLVAFVFVLVFVVVVAVGGWQEDALSSMLIGYLSLRVPLGAQSPLMSY